MDKHIKESIDELNIVIDKAKAIIKRFDDKDVFNFVEVEEYLSYCTECLFDKVHSVIGTGCVADNGEEFVGIAFKARDLEELKSVYKRCIATYSSFSCYIFHHKCFYDITAPAPLRKLFWRKKPEIGYNDGYYTLYTRLLITTKF